MFSAFGAQSNVLRNLVANNASQLNFIRSELVEIEANEKINRVIVVFATQNGCISEPCDPWFGNVVQYEFHITKPAAYRYVMSTMGISPEKIEISFTPEKPIEIPSNVAIIDWNKFLLSQKR